MSSRKATQEYRLTQWLPIIKECRKTGMTVKFWCKQNNINENQFYYWENKLRTLAGESLPALAKDQAHFVPIPMLILKSTSNNAFISAMVIRVGDAAVELFPEVQPGLLSSVLKVLKDA